VFLFSGDHLNGAKGAHVWVIPIVNSVSITSSTWGFVD
jgi:hypothetical protein